MATSYSQPRPIEELPQREPVRDIGHDGERDRSVPGLLRELLTEGSALARAELILARTEMKENLTSMQRGVTAMATGMAVLMAGLLALVAACILALSLIWPAWLSALVVGGIVSIIGLVMVMGGKSKAKPSTLSPDRTFKSLQEDQRFVAGQSTRAKESWR